MGLYFLTGNKGKFEEVRALVPGVLQLDMDIPEIQELDARAVLTEKLKAARANHSGSFVVEDTSLYFDCLGELPGPLVKWFLKALGAKGLAEIPRLYGDSGAEARTVVGYVSESGAEHFFEGALRGTIVAPRGKGGFGFDPIFLPEGSLKTLAEMSLEEKNEISMRRTAFEQLRDYLYSA